MPVRFAALTHDLGKATTPADLLPRHHGHEARSVRLATALCERLRVPSDCRDLAMRITKSHLLVTGTGNTPLEAACVGIPMVVLSRQPRHVAHGERIEEIGIGQYLGPMDEVDPGRVAKAAVEILLDNFERKAMSRSGRMLIDGRGADRMVTASEILLRRVRKTKSLPMAA